MNLLMVGTQQYKIDPTGHLGVSNVLTIPVDQIFPLNLDLIDECGHLLSGNIINCDLGMSRFW